MGEGLMIVITAPHFVAGVVFDGAGVAARTAPIIKFLRGKSLSWVTRYCERREWEWEIA